MATWENSDGLLVRFNGSVGDHTNRASVTSNKGKIREIELLLDLTTTQKSAGGVTYTADLDNDGVVDGFTGLDTPLPAGAKILNVDFLTLTTPAGGTSWTLGTFQKNGTVDTANGVLTTAGAAGAQVGTQLANDRYLASTIVGTYTAGKVKITIRYMTV